MGKTNSINSFYYKILNQLYIYFSPWLIVFSSRARASEFIQENKAKMNLSNFLKKLYEIDSFSLLLYLIEEIFMLYHKKYELTKYLGSFIKMIIIYYYDIKLSAIFNK